MELYVYGIAAFIALVVTAAGFAVAAARERRNERIVERRLRRPF